MNLFQLLANVTNDGKHPLLEFAMKFFREGKNFEAVLSDSTNEPNEPQKEKKKAKKKKSGASDADWTWKDRIDMVKWTDRMINRYVLILNELCSPIDNLCPLFVIVPC